MRMWSAKPKHNPSLQQALTPVSGRELTLQTGPGPPQGAGCLAMVSGLEAEGAFSGDG